MPLHGGLNLEADQDFSDLIKLCRRSISILLYSSASIIKSPRLANDPIALIKGQLIAELVIAVQLSRSNRFPCTCFHWRKRLNQFNIRNST